MKHYTVIFALVVLMLLTPALQAQTNCDSLSIPFIDDFNSSFTPSSYSTYLGVPPDCWIFLNIDSNFFSHPQVNVLNYDLDPSGYSLALWNGTTPPLYALLPSLGVQSEDWLLSFDCYKNIDNSVFFVVGVMNDTSNTSSFIPIDTIPNYPRNTITHFDIPIPVGTVNTGSRITFLYKAIGIEGVAFYLDNVSVVAASTITPICMSVNDVAINEGLTTDTSITLSWSDDYNSGASYSVYDMSDTSVVASGITDTFYTVSNLNPHTQYVFAVTAHCDSGQVSAMSESVSGRTACGTFIVPYTWTFEDIPLNTFPYCWANLNTSNSVVYDNYYSHNSHSGNNAFVIGGSTNNLIVLPEVEDEIRYLQLRFWTRPEYLNDNHQCGSFSVGYVTDVNDSSSFVPLHTYLYSEFSAYEERVSTFIGVPLGSRMALRYNPITIYYDWFLDDVTIEAAASCLPPINLNVDAANTYASLSWVGNSDNYNIYSISGSDTTFIQTVNGHSYNLTGLSSATEYTYGITANCGNEESDMETITFITLCDPIFLPYYEDFETDSTLVECWTNRGPGIWNIGVGDCAISYNICTYSGSLNARICHSKKGNATKFISPILMEGDHGVDLIFAHRHLFWGPETDIDTLRVYYRSGIDYPWFQVAEYSSNTEWTVDSIRINGNVFQVAFEMVDGYGLGVAIDSVVIKYNPDYPHMTSIALDSVSATSASISWTGTATSYNLYRDGNYLATTNNTSFTFTGLIQNSQYLLGVQAVEGIDSSKVASVIARTAMGDSMQVNIAVNDVTLGTTNPEPGLHYFYEGERASVRALNYSNCSLVGWSVYATNDGQPFLDTVYNVPANDVFDLISVSPWIVKNGDNSYLFNVTAIFKHDSAWLTISINDSSMGTTNPAPGIYHHQVGDNVSLTAIPYTGYEFLYWSNGDTNVTTTFEVKGDTVLSASFSLKQAIDDAECINLNVYDKNGNIILFGAEGREVYVFDINGRLLHHTATAKTSELYNVPASGVYIVKVVGIAIKRVVIVR